jgi:hypothetical protein
MVLAGCGGAALSNPSARATGTVDLSTFPTPPPNEVRATSDDGEVRTGAIASDGSFQVDLGPDQVWSFRVTFAAGGGYPIALPRTGHFDRGLETQGRAPAVLGTIWLPPAGSDVTRVFEANAASCPDGRASDGSPCAVLESLVTCADGPARPTDDPTGLVLGTGTLGDLPGASGGMRYALPSHVPPPILWECPPMAASY